MWRQDSEHNFCVDWQINKREGIKKETTMYNVQQEAQSLILKLVQILEYFFSEYNGTQIIAMSCDHLLLVSLYLCKRTKPFCRQRSLYLYRKKNWLMNIIHLFRTQAHYLYVYNNILANYRSTKQSELCFLEPWGVHILRTTELNLQIPSDLLSATLFLFPHKAPYVPEDQL